MGLSTILSLGSISAIAEISGDTQGLSALIPTVGPYRPAQWSQPALTMITVPAAYTQASPSTTSAITQTGAGTVDGSAGTFFMSVTTQQPPPDATPQLYVFDAVLRLGHSQQATITSNPIQTGANLTDHAFLKPARITMGIGMSDVMDSYAPGMWEGNASKSVAAFQVLDALRAARIPLTVTTRLKTYTTMLIEDIRIDDTIKTLHGLAAVIDFQQIFVATIASQGLSARTQTTDSNALGAVQPVPPSAGTIAQNQVPASTISAAQSNSGAVNGAGTFSSNNVSTLPDYDPIPLPN